MGCSRHEEFRGSGLVARLFPLIALAFPVSFEVFAMDSWKESQGGTSGRSKKATVSEQKVRG